MNDLWILSFNLFYFFKLSFLKNLLSASLCQPSYVLKIILFTHHNNPKKVLSLCIQYYYSGITDKVYEGGICRMTTIFIWFSVLCCLIALHTNRRESLWALKPHWIRCSFHDTITMYVTLNIFLNLLKNYLFI